MFNVVLAEAIDFIVTYATDILLFLASFVNLLAIAYTNILLMVNYAMSNFLALIMFHFFIRVTDKKGLGEGVMMLITDYSMIIAKIVDMSTRIMTMIGSLIPFT